MSTPDGVDANAVLEVLRARFPLELEIAILTVRVRDLETQQPARPDDK